MSDSVRPQFSSERPQFYLHFPGCGGTSAIRLASKLYVKSNNSVAQLVPYGCRCINAGCHAEQSAWRAALRSTARCACSSPVHAEE